MVYFKKGDWARISKVESCDSYKVGDIVRIDQDGSSCPDILLPDGSRSCALDWQLEKITTAAAANVGDTVTTDRAGTIEPGEYEVVSVKDSPFGTGFRLKIRYARGTSWISNAAVTALTRKGDVKAKPSRPAVGDWVAVTEQGAGVWSRLSVGMKGKVVEHFDSEGVKASFPGWTNGHGDGSEYNLWHSDEYERCDAPVLPNPTPKPEYIVIADTGASPRPFKHTTKIAATTEAERLSKLTPGVKFTVFGSAAIVHTARVTPPPTLIEMVA